MMSGLFFALYLVWGFFVGSRYRRWNMTADIGLALAIAPPFLTSIVLATASVLTN